MKSFRFFTILFLLLTVVQIQAQTDSTEKWVRIETEKNKLSFAVPSGFLVDTRGRQFGSKLDILYFHKDLEIRVSRTKNSNSFRISKNPRPDFGKIGDFTINKSQFTTEDSRISTSFDLEDKTHHYYLTVVADSLDKPEVIRFLCSIKIENNPLIVMNEPKIFSEETVSIESLKTSPEVDEAFERKIDDSFVKIIYPTALKDTEIEKKSDLTRPVIILERPSTKFSPLGGIIANETVKCILKVNFLANGQIGEIVVLSSNDKNFTKSSIESAKRTRFIPAQKDGKKVDSAQTLYYVAQFLL